MKRECKNKYESNQVQQKEDRYQSLSPQLFKKRTTPIYSTEGLKEPRASYVKKRKKKTNTHYKIDFDLIEPPAPRKDKRSRPGIHIKTNLIKETQQTND